MFPQSQPPLFLNLETLVSTPHPHPSDILLPSQNHHTQEFQTPNAGLTLPPCATLGCKPQCSHL